MATGHSVSQELKEALSLFASAQSAAKEALHRVAGGPHLYTDEQRGHQVRTTLGKLKRLERKLESILQLVTESQQQPSVTLESAGLRHKILEWEDSSSPCCGRTAARADSSPEHSNQQTNPSPSPTSPDPDVCRGFWDGKMWFRDSKGRLGWSRISSPQCVCGKKACQP